MANPTNDGGAAFPFQEKDGNGSHYYSHDGMSLRDWFAGQALGSIPLRQWGGGDASVIESWARCAYAVADAMLAVRGES